MSRTDFFVYFFQVPSGKYFICHLLEEFQIRYAIKLCEYRASLPSQVYRLVGFAFVLTFSRSSLPAVSQVCVVQLSLIMVKEDEIILD